MGKPVLSLLLLLLSRCCLGFIPFTTTKHIASSRLFAVPPPPGRVDDVDEWVSWSSDSLERLSGESLLDKMEGVGSVAEVHGNERYAVLSHGIQEDPIYNYFNEGALQTFLWPPEEIYSVPSRYSAPSGNVRQERQQLMQNVVEQDLRVFPTAIRQNKLGKQFQLTNVLLWNVYNNDGDRVGQTALFDRNLIVPVEDEGK